MNRTSRAIGIILTMILGVSTMIGLASPASADTEPSKATTAPVIAKDKAVTYTTRKGVEVTGTQVSGPTADAATSGESGTIEVTSESYSNVSQSLSWSNVIDILINGAHQVVWWYPNHNVKITNQAILDAPYIKVAYKPCASQSKSIAKQAHGAPIVVAKVGSVICNTGKAGNIVGGFKWKVVKPAILKWNKQLKLYEHLFTLSKPGALEPDDEVVGHIVFHGVKYAIVKKCKNRMGGHVDVMFDSVVQVRYLQDVQQSGSLEGETSANASIGLSVVCANGSRFDVDTSASASAAYSESFEFTERTKLSVEGAHRVHLFEESELKMKASARSGAKASIKVSYFCSAPPPPVYTAPSVSASAQACVAPGGTTGVDVNGLNPNDVAAPGTFTLGSRSKDLGTVAANGTPSWTFSGVGVGTYTVGFALGTPINKTATTTVTVIECVYPAPLFMQFRQFNDLYKSLPGQPTTMDHCVTVDFPSGHSGSVFWEANRGSFATTTKPAQDGVQVCSTYTAPSESGTDTITVTATDSVSGKSVQKTSDPFMIKEWPAIP